MIKHHFSSKNTIRQFPTLLSLSLMAFSFLIFHSTVLPKHLFLLINRDKPVVTAEPSVPSSRLLGLGSKLYPSNVQRMLNKDLTRFR